MAMAADSTEIRLATAADAPAIAQLLHRFDDGENTLNLLHYETDAPSTCDHSVTPPRPSRRSGGAA